MFEKNLWKSDILSKDAGHISHLVLVFLLLTLNMQLLAGNGNMLADVTLLVHFPANIYLFKISSGNITAICKICSKVIATINIMIFIVNVEQISHISLAFPLVALTNKCQLGWYQRSLIFQFFSAAIATK